MSIADGVAMVVGISLGIAMTRNRMVGKIAALALTNSGRVVSHTSIYLTCFLPLHVLAMTVAFVILSRVVRYQRSILMAEWPAVLLATHLLAWFEINQVYLVLWEHNAATKTPSLRPTGWVFVVGLSGIAVLILAGLKFVRGRIPESARAIWLVMAMAAIIAGPGYLASMVGSWLPVPSKPPWSWPTMAVWSAGDALGQLPLLMIVIVPVLAAYIGCQKNPKPSWPWTAWSSLVIAQLWATSWFLDRVSLGDIRLKGIDLLVRGLTLYCIIFAFLFGRFVMRWAAKRLETG